MGMSARRCGIWDMAVTPNGSAASLPPSPYRRSPVSDSYQVATSSSRAGRGDAETALRRLDDLAPGLFGQGDAVAAAADARGSLWVAGDAHRGL